VRVLRERGIDAGSCRSKQLSLFAVQRFGYVITLCDKVRETCPAFRELAAELETRIAYLLAGLGALAG
jgi:protein-tyrosine-phosphatase